MDWKRYGGVLLLCVSLPVQAKIISCFRLDSMRIVKEEPGLPLSSASKAGDVLLRRTYRIVVGFDVDKEIKSDQMRIGAMWGSEFRPDSGKFDTVDAVPGLGIRWRHFERGSSGRLIGLGAKDANTWNLDIDYPSQEGRYAKTTYFIQEFVLIDPASYQGTSDFGRLIRVNIYAHGTGSGASENVSKGCNQSTDPGESGGATTEPRWVDSVFTWGTDQLPPLLTPSCKLALDSKQLHVPMDAINVSGLDRKDAVSRDSVPLRIRLEECAINAKPSINFTDAGTPENTSHTLRPNNAAAAGSAKGLGVRLRRNQQTDVYFGPSSSSDGSRRIALGTASSGNPVLTLDLNAHYVRTTDAPIQPGAFAATATFVVSYP